MMLRKEIAKVNSSVSPFANWKTYTNPQLGFSFKYPQEFSVGTDMTGLQNGKMVFSQVLPGEPSSVSMFWSVFPNSKNLSLDGYANQYMQSTFSQFVISQPNKTTINGYSAISFDAALNTGNGQTSGTNANRVAFLSPDNNTIFIFTLSGLPMQSDPIFNTFDQILSTFQFTNQTSDNFKFIRDLTSPMVWSSPVAGMGKDTNGNQLTGSSITTIIPEKSQDKVAPLMATNSALNDYGWVEVGGEGGADALISTFTKKANGTTQTLVISAWYSNNKYTVFMSQ